ncbi:glycosyltransferase [bacterium]|nr:glycosyltransferase [bacterium]NBX83191.1 glycosyltransferase [bacterium]
MSKKLRVLFFSSGLAPDYGGAAISEASLCQALRQHADVRLACREDRWNRKFIRDYGLNNPLEFNPKDLFQCWKRADHPIRDWFQNVDVVHLNGHWRWEYYFLSKICRELNIPYVLHPRGMMLVAGRKFRLKQVFNYLLGRSIADQAHKIIALSQYETLQLKPYDLDADQVVVIPNGVCSSTQTEINSQQISALSDHFLYFGRLEHRKNLLFLLDAFAEYRKKGGNKKLRLKGPVERGYEQLVLQKIESLQLGHHVSILAPSYGPDKWKHLGQAIAVVYPCIEEPFGRVPFETLLAGGIPIVPSESGGAEYLSPVISEVIYPTHDVQALSERLLWAEKTSLETRSALLAKARQWVLDNLEWGIISARVVHLYWDAIAQGSLTSRKATELDSSQAAIRST